MTTKPTLIEIDPNGAWRRNRFDFCNALEAATDPASKSTAEAWAELEKFGVKRIGSAEERGKTP